MRIDCQIAKIRDLAHIPEHFDLGARFQSVVNFWDCREALKRSFIFCPFYTAQSLGWARSMERIHQTVECCEVELRIAPFHIVQGFKFMGLDPFNEFIIHHWTVCRCPKCAVISEPTGTTRNLCGFHRG